jgi:sensor domain CHASE-containing protein
MKIEKREELSRRRALLLLLVVVVMVVVVVTKDYYLTCTLEQSLRNGSFADPFLWLWSVPIAIQ